MKCHNCESENVELFFPKDRKRKKFNYIIYCQDCKAMEYIFRLGKTTQKVRRYLQVADLLKRGDNKYS